MKKIMTLLLACVMLIALAACEITPEHTHPSTKTDELYYFARAIAETLTYLEETNEYYEDLSQVLNHTFNLIDWDGEEFYFAFAKSF